MGFTGRSSFMIISYITVNGPIFPEHMQAQQIYTEFHITSH